jgi:hypothetical protein
MIRNSIQRRKNYTKKQFRKTKWLWWKYKAVYTQIKYSDCYNIDNILHYIFIFDCIDIDNVSLYIFLSDLYQKIVDESPDNW